MLLGFSSGVRRSVEFATSDGPVVTATYCLPSTAKTTGKPLTGAPEVLLPQHLAGLIVERAEAAVGVAAEHQPAARRDERHHAGALLVFPQRLASLDRDGPHGADLVRPCRDLPGMLRPYTSDGSRLSVVVFAFMHMFCSGMNITLLRGL